MIWYKIIHRILNLDDKSSKIIMEANNMWEDVYRNEYVNTQMAPHMTLHCHIFNMLGKYGKVCGKFSIYKNLDNLKKYDSSSTHSTVDFDEIATT